MFVINAAPFHLTSAYNNKHVPCAGYLREGRSGAMFVINAAPFHLTSAYNNKHAPCAGCCNLAQGACCYCL